ncbi:hypothetical protein, partial [uncultured Duncaniella sp.]|uniref:hypothetical protein n=1 Tax=uncultured Duncaniella sp. TaxID=2768039 RepID=UPI00265AB0E0
SEHSLIDFGQIQPAIFLESLRHNEMIFTLFHRQNRRPFSAESPIVLKIFAKLANFPRISQKFQKRFSPNTLILYHI